MSERPQVSVVVPFFNDPRFIGACVESVLAQSFTDLEVIIVDDGSSKESAEAASALAGDRVRYVRHEHSGLSATRNRGVDAARGDIVAFIDSDDIWLPEKLEKQLAISSSFEGVVYGTVIHVDEAGRTIATSDDFDRFKKSPDAFSGNVFHTLLEQNVVHPSTLLMRKSLYGEIGGFRVEIGPASDWDFVIRAAERYPFRRLDEPLVRVIRRRDSMGSDPIWLRADMTRVLNDARARLVARGALDAEATAALGLGYFASRNMRLAAVTLLKAILLRPWRVHLWRWLAASLLWRPIRRVIPPAWTPQ